MTLTMHPGAACVVLADQMQDKYQQIKTTPTPNKNGSYAIKGGFVCHILVLGPYAMFCRNPVILTDFYAIPTPIVWHSLGAHFLQNIIMGGGVVRIIFKVVMYSGPGEFWQQDDDCTCKHSLANGYN